MERFYRGARILVIGGLMSWVIWAHGVCSDADADSVEPLSADWTPQRRIPYRVAATRPSGTFGGDTGPYASSKAVDGEPETKWVAPDEPSDASPQWLELELDGSREVAALAVFCGRPDNDGILAARVQVARADNGAQSFADAAKVDQLSTGAWLVTFAPIRTDRVRLLITKSGPPSPHTDVNEVVVLSRELASGELADYVLGELKRTAADLNKLANKVQRLTQLDARVAASLKQHIGRLQGEAGALSRELQASDKPGQPATGRSRARVEALDAGVRSLATLVSRSLPSLNDHAATLRRSAQPPISSSERPVSVKPDGDKLVIENRELVLVVDQRTGAWDCTWRRSDLTGLKSVEFKVNVDGKTTTLQDAACEHAPFQDKLGSGTEVVHRVDGALGLERRLRVYQDRPAVVVAARITNKSDHDVAVNDADLIDVAAGNKGWWQVGLPLESPGAVTVQGSSELICEPPGLEGGSARRYASCGVCGFAFREPSAGFVVGFLSAQQARPAVYALFQPGGGGSELLARLPFRGRKLKAGESIDLDPVYVAVDKDPYAALETYGAAVAAMSAAPPRTKPTSLWCSWYAHRLKMTEDLVLANAAVAARHFKPLGLEVIQLDHGWQRGDVDGDWVVNKKFPHGLKWLADELRTRHGLKLGAWIAPVDVAETSDTFKNHPDWMLMDEQGRPKQSGRWFWEPNPMCYVLDASKPEAEQFIEDTFAKLTADGVQYYKIDFIAVCGSEGFRQHDPYTVQGWGVLNKAMQAIRRGAGPDAFIRYCQTPPWLSVGLADGAYGGADTSDSGVPTVINTLRTNARSIAAGYWIHDRLYHREVCDMSVGMRGPLWEARMKLAMMALGGTSVSFSDELTYLPPSRIRMMQQCLPPGGPAMRPLDLFERSIPALSHVHCKTQADEWDVVGVFNFEDEPQTFHIELDRLGLGKAEKVTAFEFWNERFLGVREGQFDVRLAPHETQILILRKLRDRPFIVATDMHALGGFHELAHVAWDAKSTTLSGRYRRAPGMTGKVYIYAPPSFEPVGTFPLSERAARLTNVGNRLWMQEIEFVEPELSWSIPFSGSASAAPAAEPNDF